jgi:hypothetical protein
MFLKWAKVCRKLKIAAAKRNSTSQPASALGRISCDSISFIINKNKREQLF